MTVTPGTRSFRYKKKSIMIHIMNLLCFLKNSFCHNLRKKLVWGKFVRRDVTLDRGIDSWVKRRYLHVNKYVCIFSSIMSTAMDINQLAPKSLIYIHNFRNSVSASFSIIFSSSCPFFHFSQHEFSLYQIWLHFGNFF
jgi:hypothetical protein